MSSRQKEFEKRLKIAINAIEKLKVGSKNTELENIFTNAKKALSEAKELIESQELIVEELK